MKILSVRLDAELDEKLEFILNKRKVIDKSAYIRQLLANSIKEDLIDFLCDEIKKKQMSAWKAAQIAEISLLKMLDECAKRQIILYDQVSLEEDLQFAFGE
jgi:predicted HTH domain antitoxin